MISNLVRYIIDFKEKIPLIDIDRFGITYRHSFLNDVEWFIPGRNEPNLYGIILEIKEYGIKINT